MLCSKYEYYVIIWFQTFDLLIIDYIQKVVNIMSLFSIISVLDLLFGIVIIYCLLSGYRKGAMTAILGFVTTLVGYFAAAGLSPQFASTISNLISPLAYSRVSSVAGTANMYTDGAAVLSNDNMHVLTTLLERFNVTVSPGDLVSTGLDTPISRATQILSDQFSKFIAFIIIFILIKLILSVILKSLVSNITLFRTIDNILGGVIGIVGGLVVMFVLCLAINNFAPETSSSFFSKQLLTNSMIAPLLLTFVS